MLKIRLQVFLFLSVLIFSQAYCNEDALARVILTPQGKQSEEEVNKEIIRKYYLMLSRKNISDIQEMLDSRISYTMLNEAPHTNFPEFSKDFSMRANSLWKAFPDLTWSVDSLIAEGNKVVARVKLNGTQKGSFLGIEPTNRFITINKIAIFTLQNEKIIYISEMWNLFEIMKQLGYMIL